MQLESSSGQRIWTYPYFTQSEMRCRCGNCEGLPTFDFMDILVTVREEAGFPFIVSSAYRCPEYNALVSNGSLDGPHVRGVAVDILVRGEHALRLIVIGQKHGMTGFGIKQHGNYNNRFLHLDTLSREEGFQRPFVWTYS